MLPSSSWSRALGTNSIAPSVTGKAANTVTSAAGRSFASRVEKSGVTFHTTLAPASATSAYSSTPGSPSGVGSTTITAFGLLSAMSFPSGSSLVSASPRSTHGKTRRRR